MKNKNTKCIFCSNPIGDQSPYNDEGDHYHTNCHFLINDIKNMNRKTLVKLAILIQESLHSYPGDHSEINCC